MNILITGAKGFVGKNLCAQLKNIKEGKDKTHPGLEIEEIYEYDIDSTPEELDAWCKDCDFVFNLAGVNRPKDPEEFMKGNFGFATTLLNTLKKYENHCPVMLSSSAQASLTGRFGNSEYGRSKKAGEDLFFRYEQEFLRSTNNLRNQNQSAKSAGLRPRVLIYRFPNLFGKWCRPNYNSAVATFCNNIANDLPITVNDPSVELDLLYIDDLVDEMIGALEGKEHRCKYMGLTPIPFPKRKGGAECFAEKYGIHTSDPALYDVLKENAESNRKNSTEAEEILWKALKGNGIEYKFRRQHIIKDYIVDFFCNELNLTIEVDGGYHNTPDQRKYDDLRTRELMELGYTELRFKNEEVLFDLDRVLSDIKQAADTIKSFLSGEDLGEAYCYCPITHKITLGEIVDLLHKFAEMPKTLMIPEIPDNSFAKKLFTTYLSYLPKEKAVFDLKMNVDDRGSFTELVHTLNCGQVSINISKPGITKGQHWHNTKWELFIVVAGHGLIQLRKEGTDEVINYEVSGDKIQAVYMLPGYTHNIINLSDTEDLVTVMYCNEIFNPNKPDTFFDPV